MAKHRIALGISYQGQNYFGWQVQTDRPTVQAQVEKALSQFITVPTQVVCAGRTDTGVHAVNQIVHLDTDATRSDNSWVRGGKQLFTTGYSYQMGQRSRCGFSCAF